MGDAPALAGAWRERGPRVREGCEVLLRAAGQTAFLGSTLGRRCLGTLRGATFATSEVVVLRDVLLGWDRGFGGSGEEVWGAENDPFIFRKIKNLGLD